MDIQRESQTRDDRSDDRFWLERKGKAVTGFHWLDSREMPKEGISTIEIESQSRAEGLRVFPDCSAVRAGEIEIKSRVDNLAHEPPARLRIADEKIFSLQKSGDTHRAAPFSSTRSLNTTQQPKTKMACIASSFTGSVAALKATKIQVRIYPLSRLFRRSEAVR